MGKKFHHWRRISEHIHHCHYCNLVRTGIHYQHNSTFKMYEFTRQDGSLVSRSWVPQCEANLRVISRDDCKG